MTPDTASVAMRDALERRVARIIIGPRGPLPAGHRRTLEQLQEIRWEIVSAAERADAEWAARAILAALATSTAPSEPQDVGEVLEAAQAVIDHARRSYRSRGRDRYIEDDSGEMMMLVPHEDWYLLHCALERAAIRALMPASLASGEM